MSTTKTQQRVSLIPTCWRYSLNRSGIFSRWTPRPRIVRTRGCIRCFRRIFPLPIPETISFWSSSTTISTRPAIRSKSVWNGLTYSVPLKAKLKLYCTDDEHEDFGVVVQDVYFGTIPYMTERGTFVINGAERVIVSQLHRSPGVFFGQSMHTNGTKLYSARIIPFKGSWIEFATDINNVMYAYIDRKKKLPVTTLLRAIGFEADQQILEIFDLADEVKVTFRLGSRTSWMRIRARWFRSNVTT